MVGVDIGGTKILAAAVGADGVLGELVRIPTPAADGPDAILAAAIGAAHQAATGIGIAACGIGTAGAVDPAGRISHATATLPGWLGTDVRGAFEAALGVRTIVLNDVHAMAVGEAAGESGTVLVVAAGTGVGGALLRDGVLLTGEHGLAGSVGHLPSAVRDGRPCGCGGVDHVEAYAAGPAIAADYAVRAGRSDAPPLEAVATAAAAGDAAAIAAIDLGAHVLGAGLGAAATLLDPVAIVLGGGVLNLGDRYLSTVRKEVTANSLGETGHAVVRTTAWGPAAVVAGAARAAQAERT
ncbi:MAG: ROK family protein [Hamadaea sp.]|uniref:ROK family protein n=1 Tax=Hamadaea sp. TaxID=2024425 RepID=UPI00184A94B0|nr:ROK family protein [Hamadaea sp.]NUT20591.1 ROK family protein [Hamadaea sp.]